jgi:hypothetical protein
VLSAADVARLAATARARLGPASIRSSGITAVG